MTVQEHVGKRIHLYRKKQNLTLQQVAYLMGKTPSTISKYEKGAISIDIGSLYQLAEILNVNAEQLLDYQPETRHKTSNFALKGFFSLRRTYHLYQYFAPMRRIIRSVLEISSEGSENSAKVTLYYDVPNPGEYTLANFIYRGQISTYDSFATIHVKNDFALHDDVYFYIKSPLWIRNVTTGFMLSYSQTMGMPSVAKIVFSATPLEENEPLLHTLNLNTKDIQSMLKKTNCIVLTDNWEVML